MLAYNVLVALWGAYVRATGAGAGCGKHWPLCNGDVVPLSGNVKSLIEYTHRATSGIDVALVAVMALWAFRAFPKRHPVRLGATLSAIFLFTEALLGASLVLLEHVAGNTSPMRAYSQSAHLINTLVLLAVLALTAWWTGGNPRLRLRGKPAWMAAATLGAVVLLGVTGAIAALGDTLFPAQSLAQGFARDLDPSASIFVRVRVFHPAIAVAAAAWLIFYTVGGAARQPDMRSRAWLVLGLLGAQLTAGVFNLLLMAPVWLQIVHLLLAYAVWISLVLFCAETLKYSSKTSDMSV